MNMIHRIIFFMLVSVVAACANNGQTINASNDEDRDIGLGGTGMLADTGSGLGGTGIVGEITGFGSIFVNGVEIEYHEGTPFSVDGESMPVRALEIGDVVEVLATDSSKHTQAQHINIRHEVIGTVTSVDEKTSTFTVLGQTVIQPGNSSNLPPAGSAVAVSGIRVNKSVIQATRIEPAKPGKDLLREDFELPYQGQADRWQIQAHINNRQLALKLDGVAHTLSISADKAQVDVDTVSNIIEVSRDASGKLNVNSVNLPRSVPQGRQSKDRNYFFGRPVAPSGIPFRPSGSLMHPGPGSIDPGPAPDRIRRP